MTVRRDDSSLVNLFMRRTWWMPKWSACYVGRLSRVCWLHAKALDVWKRLGLIRYAASPLLERVWELRAAVTSYDAMYVALAENLDCALITTDARLSGANGPRCVITVVPR